MLPEHQLSKSKVNMTSFWHLMVMGSGNVFYFCGCWLGCKLRACWVFMIDDVRTFYGFCCGWALCGVLLLCGFFWLDVNQELQEFELKYQGLWQNSHLSILVLFFVCGRLVAILWCLIKLEGWMPEGEACSFLEEVMHFLLFRVPFRDT